MSNSKIKVGVVGSTGLLSGFLIKLLHAHPHITIETVVSESNPNISIDTFHPFLRGITTYKTEEFKSNRLIDDCQVVFFCKPHGKGIEQTLQLVDRSRDLKIIDLSANFRLKQASLYDEWYKFTHPFPESLVEFVYGLPELNAEEIKKANFIANPGCYPTSIILAVAPLYKNKLVHPKKDLIIDSYSGVSGAGKQLNSRNMAINVEANIITYKVTDHQHTPEIEQELTKLLNEEVIINFVPHVAPFKYGIVNTIFVKLRSKIEINEIVDLYRQFYKPHPFIRIYSPDIYPEIQYVEGTNFCDIGFSYNQRTETLIVISAIDNVIKGGVGQAIQNMNIMYGWDENIGL
ncbi:MAG: N-acetyl-gamma-glutamyl-phosphate reductase [bacterium]